GALHNHFGWGLTRRCSGLAALAADRDIVSRLYLRSFVHATLPRTELARLEAEVCARAGVQPLAPEPLDRIALSRELLAGLEAGDVSWPAHGLRHPAHGNMCGWYAWSGQVFPADPDAFVPIHFSHLQEAAYCVVPYLALPVGWRFLIAPGHEDTWYDPALLNI
ncbi:MAG TPA: hypothetical protein PLB02_04020, partial [Thermoanaerobaculia bacterium]|nr:hypothetical protein [Thermoanaerobaculia bacterium]